MSAVKLKIDWKATDDREIHGLGNVGEVAKDQSPMVRTITPTVEALRCPHCESIVYSRRSKVCGVCSRELPAEYHFSATESERLEKMLHSERSRHRRWMSRAFNQAVTLPYFE